MVVSIASRRTSSNHVSVMCNRLSLWHLYKLTKKIKLNKFYLKKIRQRLPYTGGYLTFLNLQIHNIYATNQLIFFNFFQQIRIIQFAQNSHFLSDNIFNPKFPKKSKIIIKINLTYLIEIEQNWKKNSQNFKKIIQNYYNNN